MVNEPFQWSVETIPPFRSWVVSIHSISYVRLLLGRTDFTSMLTVCVCPLFCGGSAR